MEKRLIPEIRFKGFNGDWEKQRLEDITIVKDGTHDSPHYYREGFPLVTSKNLVDGEIDLTDINYISEDDYNEINKRSKVDDGDILLALIGTIGNPVLVKESNFAIKNIGLIKNSENFDNRFLVNHLQADSFLRYTRMEMTGNTQKFLGLGKLRGYKLLIPELNEQEKIGRLFESLDQTIDLQGKVLEENKRLKQALLQKLFPKKGQKLPELRLKGFSGFWKEKKLGEILTEVVEKSTENNQYQILSSTTSGIYLQREYFKNQIASTDNTGYKILRLNQIVLSPQNLWMGNININYKYEIGLVSPSYKIFDINKDYDKTFVSKILNTKRAYYEYEVNSEQGASIVRKNLNMNNFLKIKFKVPSLPEQEAIGKLFKALDEKIAREEERLEGYKTLKKSLLQKMFV